MNLLRESGLSSSKSEDRELSVLFSIWGQFIAHDITQVSDEYVSVLFSIWGQFVAHDITQVSDE